jgi:flagellar biogenesis protein FliO
MTRSTRHEEVGRMVGEVLAILAVVALCLWFLREVGSPYHR